MKDLQLFLVDDENTRQVQGALVERILAKLILEESSQLRNFLQHMYDRTLDGYPEKEHEQFIGHRVFNRPINYKPADENIVSPQPGSFRVQGILERLPVLSYPYKYGGPM